MMCRQAGRQSRRGRPSPPAPKETANPCIGATGSRSKAGFSPPPPHRACATRATTIRREDTYVEAQRDGAAGDQLHAPRAGCTGGAKAAALVVLKLAPYEFEELKIAESRIDRICEATERARQHYEARLNHVQHRIQDLLREALKNRTAHAAKHFAQPHPLMPMWLYVAVMLVMGAAELLFNATAFRLIESGQDYQSYIMAVAPTLSLLMMAHFLGVKWRQWPRDQVWKNAAIAAAIFITITLASYALGIMRAEFVEVRGAEASARAATEAQLNAADERASLERQVEELRIAARDAKDKARCRRPGACGAGPGTEKRRGA